MSKNQNKTERADKEERRLNRNLDQVENLAPGKIGRAMAWIRDPSKRWVRIPAGILLVLGGIFSILPVLGLWMLPVGLLLLAIDLAVLRGPVNRAVAWISRKWQVWRRK